MKKKLAFCLMDGPFEQGRTVTGLRLIDLALQRGHDVTVFAYEGAVALPFAHQAKHANAVHGCDVDEEDHPLTREWIAVHRKHHAYCETPDDPHSPQIYGLKKVMLEGAELYRAEKDNPETLEKFGRGAPDDWLERNVYLRFPFAGIVLLVVTSLLLFGVPGIIIIAVQLSTMPVFAAGVINGLGHHTGYRNSR